MKSILLLAILLLSSVSSYSQNRGGETENTTETSKGKTHAIIIGISGYKNLPQSNQLDFADDDALLLKEYLSKFADINLKLFLNEAATNKDVIGVEIYDLLYKDAQPGDNVIIYFAGHGDVDEVEDGFLLLNQVDPPEVSTYDFNDALPISKIQKYVNLAASKRNINVTFIADACHSGSVKKGAANTKISELYNDNAVTITSCQKDQVSKESMDWGGGHGVFTFYLVQGLMGMADTDGDLANNDGIVTLDELEGYVKSRVNKSTEKAQTPVFFGGSTNKEMAIVNAELLELAKSNDGLTLKGLSSFGKSKALGIDDHGLDGPCKALLQMMQNRTIEKKFYEEELDSLDRMPILVGPAVSKKNHSGAVTAVVSSPNLAFSASAGADGIALYAGTDLKNPIWLKGHSGAVKALSFSSFSGNLISGGADANAIIWDVESKEKVNSIALSSEVTSIQQINEDEIALGTVKGTIAIWNIKLSTVKEYKMHKGAITSLVVSGNTIVTAGEDSKLLAFDNLSKKKTTAFEYLGTPIRSLALKGLAGEVVSISEDGMLQTWNIESRKLNSGFKTMVQGLNSIVIDPFEKIAFIGGPKQKRLLMVDLTSSRMIAQKSANTSGINSLDYDPVYLQVRIGEVDGSITVQTIKSQPEKSSALDLYEQLKDCGDLSAIQHKIDGTIVVGLNSEVNKVLNPLVNGAANLPDLAKVQKALKYATTAYEIGGVYELDADQLEINKLLLEVYEILLAQKADQYSKALERVSRIEALDPKGAYVYNVSAKLYALLNDAKMALEMSAKAEKIAPTWAETGVNTGRILAQTGDKKAAEVKFKEVIQKAPTQSKGYTALGELYLEQGKLEEAKVQLEKALKIDSGASVPTKVYRETMSQIELIQSRGGDLKYPAPLNVAFYRNYVNVLKMSTSDYKSYKISTSNSSLKTDANTGVKSLRVSGPATSVFVTLTSTTTGKVIGTYEIPVKDLPKVDLWYGNSKTGEVIDENATEIYYGYNPEKDPDLSDAPFKILEYIVEIPNTMKQYKHYNSLVGDALKAEIAKSKRSKLKGGACVYVKIANKQGETFNVQGCFDF
ncbi:MAG: caspase family protein [Bacteroidota bacterium]